MKDNYIQLRISTKEKKRFEEFARDQGESLTNFLMTAARERIELNDRLKKIEKRLENIERLLQEK